MLSLIIATSGAPAEATRIGVADGGLFDPTGSPLPPEAFLANELEQNGSERFDDDDNNFEDDLFGAGMRRGDEIQASGNLGVCAGPIPHVAAFEPSQLELIDHGSIVASLASGLPLYDSVPSRAIFPRIIFFRLFEDFCANPASGAQPDAVIDALRYLFVNRNSQIVVASFLFASEIRVTARDQMAHFLNTPARLLVLPAGNTQSFLDEDKPCPPCLGNLDMFPETAAGALVVGGADQDLRIIARSGYGPETVFIYAPAEARGARRATGEDAGSYGPATSWAAPNVAFAAGIMRSLGVGRYHNRELRERLQAAIWPINEPADRASAGVLNLMKAAAVRHTSIEVLQRAADGRLERWTYVGELLTPLGDLCPGFLISPQRFHSIHFGETSDDQRVLRLRSRNYSEQRREYPLTTQTCSLPTEIWFDDLLRGEQPFNSADIVHLLLRWIPG